MSKYGPNNGKKISWSDPGISEQHFLWAVLSFLSLGFHVNTVKEEGTVCDAHVSASVSAV